VIGYTRIERISRWFDNHLGLRTALTFIVFALLAALIVVFVLIAPDVY
jgi:hypothetical protein